jgi:glycosyltransferase involved in cell wall biosynthesis
MKIGILGTRGIPNAYGGFEQFAEQLAAGLTNKGHEIFVYNSSLHPYKEDRWQGVHIIHCKDWEDKLEAAGQFIYDLNCIRDARERKFDILLQLGYTSNSVWHWWWPKKTINIVNMDGMEWKRTQYSKLTRAFLKRAEAWAVKYADQLIADSLGMQQHLLKTYNKLSTFIPYAAKVFTDPDPFLLNIFHLNPYQYYLVVARMEPENNIEMILRGYLNSKQTDPLIIIGRMNRFGKTWAKKYKSEKIKFLGAVYDKKILNNLRWFSKLHFHGHSVGGTNPSLLEAMACGCSIVAHDNIFNRAVLQDDADFFCSEDEITKIIAVTENETKKQESRKNNLLKIENIYNPDKILNEYETLFINNLQSAGRTPFHDQLPYK